MFYAQNKFSDIWVIGAIMSLCQAMALCLTYDRKIDKLNGRN